MLFPSWTSCPVQKMRSQQIWSIRSWEHHPDQSVLNFVDAMLAGDSGKGLNTLHQSAERGNDPVQFTKQVVAYFRNVLLMKMDNADRIDVPENLFRP